MYELTVIIPTLNEADTVREMVTKIFVLFESRHIFGQVLVVDDNSTDGTIDILKGLQADYPHLDVLIREKDHGLSQSLVDGFKRAGSDICLVIDSDGQWPADKIPCLYDEICRGYDIAIASRYLRIEGSGFNGLSYYRRLLSWGATQLAQFFFPGVTDSGSGFFIIRKEVIKDAPLKPQGFRMLFEILGKGYWKTVKEVPVMFGTRQQGVSKLTIKTIIAYLKQLWGLFKFSFSHKDSHGYTELRRIATFMAVGASGTVLNISLLYLLTEWVGLWYVSAALVGIEMSIISNFLLNDTFTFKDITNQKYTWLHRVITYHLVSAIGSVINIMVLIGLTELAGVWYVLSGLIGVGIAFIWNFIMNRNVTWTEAEK